LCTEGKGKANYIYRLIKKYKLNCKSEHKFIPDIYKYASITQRISLLQGLMDTDGTVSNKGYGVSYSSSSKQLAEDVADLIRSLGGIASIRPKPTKCLLSYNVSVNLYGIQPFSLPRKQHKVKEKSKYKDARYILNIEELIKTTEMQCITVDNKDSLYLTNNYTITHNSYVVSRIIEQYLFENQFKRVAFSATTNKAVKVAYRSTTFMHPSLEFCTIHKLLALKEVIQADGTIDFYPDKFVVPSINEYDVVFIDEASMLGKRLFGYLLDYVDKVKIIFVGDDAQIVPVKETESIVFNSKTHRDHNMVCFKLTDIIRQAADNPIINVTTWIRNNLNNNIHLSYDFGYQNKLYQTDKGVYFLDKSDRNDKAYFDELLAHIFCSPNFKDDADFGKVLAYTNKVVNKLNKNIRRLIYGPGKLRRIEPGEKIVTKSPVFDMNMDRIVINNAEELIVESFERRLESVNDGQFQIPYYETKVTLLDISGRQRTELIKIPTDLGMIALNEILGILGKAAKSFKAGTFQANSAWRDFWFMKKSFADVSYNYALSLHLSQGSTFQNVVVLEYNTHIQSRIIERNKLIYTGCTRPSDRLYIL